MPFSRQQKEQLLESYRETIARSPHAFLVNATGITVPQITALRDRVRSFGGRYVVVKNRLAIRAIEGAALEGLKDQFVGPTAVAFGDDPVQIAKVLTEFSKEVKAFEFKGGLLDGQPVTAEKVADIASLPSRDELLAKLLFLLQSPITRLARTLAAIPREFVIVLDQIRQQKEATSA